MTTGMVFVAFLAACAAGVALATISSGFIRTSSSANPRQTSYISRGKSVIDSNVLSIDVTQVSQTLQEGLLGSQNAGEHCEKTYSRDFLRLLRLSGNAKRKEQGTKSKTDDALPNVLATDS